MSRKMEPFCFYSNSAKGWPIIKCLSPADLAVNF